MLKRARQGNLPDLEAGFSRKLKRLIVHCGAHNCKQLQALLIVGGWQRLETRGGQAITFC